MADMDGARPPQIKICGLTAPDEAEACAAAGADAIGFISYAKSPRYMEDQAIRRITAVLPETLCTVGVFVNEGFDRIMRTVTAGRLKAVQLHGAESPDLVAALAAEGLIVIKTLLVNGTPGIQAASRYPAAAFLVECTGGPLPGGNALRWNWSDLHRVPADRPLILAGGLAPPNIQTAIAAANPDAVDVSSGVETSPGRKNLAQVAAFCQAVAVCRRPGRRKVFG